MFGSGVAFGERVVIVGRHSEYRLPARVLMPGPGDTVADRVDNAIDPVSETWRLEVCAALGVSPYQQCEVDFAAADRLYPATAADHRLGYAKFDLGGWRSRLQHCPPGARLAALLEQRPDDPAPGIGAGTVENGVMRPIIPGGPPLRVLSVDPGPDGPPVPAPAAGDPWPQAVLETVVARQKLISHLHAQQYHDIATLSACYPGIQQFLATELGLALHLTDTDAANLLGTAEALRNRLPDTATALHTGRIDQAKAEAIVHATANCSTGDAHLVERSVLPAAEQVTATTVRRRAARAVIATDPDGAAHRHRQAVRERHAWRTPDTDGMARLGLYASATDVDTVWRAITAVADAIKFPGDTRTLGQRRADALVMISSDILDAGGWSRLRLPDKGLARPRINVTVPYTVLLGHRAPCEVDGHGPIPAEQALPLIAAGDLYRMLCDPESGALRDYGHTRYRPPPHLEAFVRHRDGECPMPTCHHPAERGQIDHIVPARPDPVTGTPTLGTTSAGNLAAPCHHHHLAKDAGRGFTLHRDPNDGGYTWTTPLGYTYTWQPDPLWHPDTDPITGIQADWADGYARPPDAGGPVDQPTADPPGSGPPTIPAVSEPNSAPTGDPPGNGPPKAGTGAHPAGAKPSIPGTSPTAAAGLAKSSGGTRTSTDPPEDDPPPF